MSTEKKTATPAAPPSTAALERDHARLAALKRAVADVGLVRRGSLTQVWGYCGNKNCRCAADPPRPHGPYVQWTRKVAGKTAAVRLRLGQEPLFEEWVRNSRRLDELVDEIHEVSMRITEHLLRERWPKPHRRTPKR
jgi:hypothetical protein